MSHTLTRRNISAIAKLDFSDLGHAQRVDAIAKALGYEAGGALMATLKGAEGSNTDEDKTPIKAITSWGVPVTRALYEDEPIHDEDGDPIDGEIHEIEFATEGELNAYREGVEDAMGWDEGGVYSSTANDPNYDYWKAKALNPDLEFSDWYHANQLKMQAERDAEMAEAGGDQALP
jgi:hypothetical protein